MTPDRRPVVIIGAARSGTKFLRDLVAGEPGFAPIPYDVNYVWRLGSRHDHDALDPGQLDERTGRHIRATLDKLAGRRPGDGRRLIEKTVSNCLRVPFVDRVLPDAVYLHLVRDGHAVIESALRLWRAPPDGPSLLRKLAGMPISNAPYAAWFAWNQLRGRLAGRAGGEVWGPRYPGIFEDVRTRPLLEVVALQWAHCVVRATDDLAALPAGRVLTVRYEALLNDPATLRRLRDFLGIAESGAIERAFRQSADPSNLEKWRTPLGDEAIATIRRIAGDALARHGYL